MPHILIAGTTGSGKSICVNSLIISLLYNTTPDQIRLVMIDPKVVELQVYNGIPQLMIPVVTKPKDAAGALNSMVEQMLSRYDLFAAKGARDIRRYNQMMEEEGGQKLPYIVIVVDELADLMMAAPSEVEDAICRLAQMARAAGMHLIVATQSPRVDVITGMIKANIPSRIAFMVASQMDSRVILDMGGAEKLLGRGDMLFYPNGASKPVRVQGAFVSDQEVERVTDFIKAQSVAAYNEDVLQSIRSFELQPKKGRGGRSGSAEADSEDSGMSERQYDVLLGDAVDVIYDANQASISMVQRRLRVGYSRAARIVDELEELGIVSPSTGSKPREIIRSRADAQLLVKEYGA